MIYTVYTKVFYPKNCIFFIAEDGEPSGVKDEEKKQREHLLALNQVIARQVMEKSRMVAGKITKNGYKKIMHVSFFLFIFLIMFQFQERNPCRDNPLPSTKKTFYKYKKPYPLLLFKAKNQGIWYAQVEFYFGVGNSLLSAQNIYLTQIQQKYRQ